MCFFFNDLAEILGLRNPESDESLDKNKDHSWIAFCFFLPQKTPDKMDVSENNGIPKSSHFNRGFPVLHYFHHPFGGFSPHFLVQHPNLGTK